MTAPQKPAARTIRYELKDPYAGFYVEARADFPARTLADLSSGDFSRAMLAFDKLIVSHNLTDNANNRVESVMDADPYELVTKAMEGWVEQLGKLPPR
jgi:hypothetical protein